MFCVKEQTAIMLFRKLFEPSFILEKVYSSELCCPIFYLQHTPTGINYLIELTEKNGKKKKTFDDY